jgi:hypothetical protein
MKMSDQGGSPDEPYEGLASEDPDPEFVADEQGRPKIKLSVEGALRHAYKNAKAAGARPPFLLEETEIHGNNPISDYKVRIRPRD